MSGNRHDSGVRGIIPPRNFQAAAGATTAPSTHFDYELSDADYQSGNPMREVSRDEDGRLVVTHPDAHC